MTFSLKFVLGLSLACGKRIVYNSLKTTTRLSSRCLYLNKNIRTNVVNYKAAWEKNDRNSDRKLIFIIGANAMFFGLFGPDNSDEEKIPDVITTIKRSILMIQRGDYKRAEQLLHVALRQAQSVQNNDAVTYIYDVMANLAFDVGDYQKAESLFVSVMQRLISSGTSQDDIKIIHISLKMAKLFEYRGEQGKAEDGYKFCLKHLQDRVDKGTEDEDIVLLWAMTMDWYARMLLTQAKHDEAFKYFFKAYQVSLKINGEDHEQTAILLNDLGTLSFLKGDNEGALAYLTQAAEIELLSIGRKLPHLEELAAIHVNLGNVFIQSGLYDAAKKSCQEGWKLSKKLNNRESLVEANDCLDEINKLLSL